MGMFEDFEVALYYSEEQRALMKENTHDVNVILLPNQDMPLLMTEMRTNRPLSKDFNLESVGFLKKDPDDAIKSNWKDAVQLYKGQDGQYQTLLNGLNEVTKAGEAFCTAHNIPATPEALRAIALTPAQRKKRIIQQALTLPNGLRTPPSPFRKI